MSKSDNEPEDMKDQEGAEHAQEGEADDSGDDAGEIEVFHRVNRLKLKAGASSLHSGPGFIDPKAINRAQTVIENKQTAYKMEIKDILEKLDDAWKRALAVPPEEAGDEIEEVYHYANHAKDLAAMFGYELMQHFGYSLRDFAGQIDMTNKAHHVIVKAHLDVMGIVFQENIKDHGGPKAEELKQIVAVAIKRYS